MLALVVEPVRALQLRTPNKWNGTPTCCEVVRELGEADFLCRGAVNAQNVMVWTPERGDPTRFDAFLRHPVYLPKPGYVPRGL